MIDRHNGFRGFRPSMPIWAISKTLPRSGSSTAIRPAWHWHPG